MSEIRGQGTAGTTTQAKFTVGRSPAEAAKEVAIPEDAEIILTQEEGTTTASLAPLVLEKPPAGITETVVWTPGTPLVTAFPLDSAASVVTEVIDGVTYTVFTWPDGAVLRVAGLDPEDQGIGDLPVTLEDGTVLALDDFAAIAGVEPAAGPGAGATPAGPGNNGHGTGPAGPGDIGSGPGDTGPLGYTELFFSVPELTEDTDPLEEEEAESVIIVSINSVEVTEGDPIEGGEGGEGGSIVDDPTTTITFTVTLSQPSTVPVTVHYVVNQGTDPTGAFEGIVIQHGGPEGDYSGGFPTTSQVDIEEGGISAIAFKLADNADVPDGSSPTTAGPSTGYQTGTYTFTESGTFTLVWAAFNEGDTAGDYNLLLDNIQLNGVLLEGFEGGAFTNPDIGPLGASTISFENGFAGVGPTQGAGQLRLESEGVDAADIAALLGLPEATIQAFLNQLGNDGNSANGDENLTDGALLVLTLTVSAGDVLTFDFDHIASDGNGAGATWNDTSFFATDGAGLFSSTYNNIAPLEGDITFAPGETSQTITLNIVDDTVFEPTEQFTVALSDPVGASIGANPGVGTILDNDPAPTLLIGDASAFEGDALVFDLTLTNASSETIVVQLNTASGSADEGTDFTSIDGTLVTFNPGETFTTVTVSSLEDDIFEPNELFSVTGAQVSGTVAIGNTGTGTILDDDPTPSLLIGDASAQEGDVLTFSVTLSNPSFEDIVVQIDTTSGTATEGTDFTTIDGTLVTFLAGSTSATVTVSSTEDSIFEPNETFSVTGTQVSGSVNIFDSGTGTILDDDPLPTLLIGDATATEGNTLVFAVTLTTASSEDIVVRIDTASGTADEGPDFTTIDNTLVTFLAGQTSASVTVSSIDDEIFEATETFSVTGTQVAGTVVTGDTGTGTILDNDPGPTLLINDVSALEGDVLVFALTLTNPSAEDIVVTLQTGGGSATEGTDYTSIDGIPVTFLAGETSHSVTVSSLEDNVFEGDETFSVSAGAIAGTVNTDDTGTGTIIDDESTPTLEISDATAFEGDTLVFTLTLPGPSAEQIVIQVNATDGTAFDGTGESGSGIPDYVNPGNVLVTFAPGETTATVTISSVEDNVLEPTETFVVSTTAVEGSVHAGDTGIGTILDDDPIPSLTIGDATTEEGGTLVFDLTLSNPSFENIVVQINTSDGTALEGTDFTSIDGTLVTFLAGQTSATVTVSSTEDTIFEPNETFSVTGTQVSGSVNIFDSGTGTILDDDPVPTLLIGDATAQEGDTLVFDVTLTNPSSENIVVQINTSDGTALEGTDFTTIDGTLVTFLAGQTSATVTVSSTEDTIFEPNETFSVTGTQVSGSVSTGDTGTGTILNDDPVPTLLIGDATALEGDTLVFDVTLTNPSFETIVVSLNTGGGSALEGTDYTTIDGTLVTFLAGETSATVTVSSTEDTIFEGTETFSVTGAQVSGTVSTGDTGTGTILDDDGAPSLLIGDATANEGDALVFDVTLSNPSFEDIVVRIDTGDGTALEGTDFASIDGTLVTFLAGETSATVTVSSTEDTIFEPNETFSVTGTQVSGSVDIFDSGTGTILDDDPVPTLLIGDATANEGDALVFDVTLTNPSSETIVVSLNTGGGSATEGTDYASIDGTLVTFLAGETSATVTVSSTEDTTFEGTETFSVTGAQVSGSVVTGDTGTGTILDDDNAPTLLIGDATANEGDALVFDVTLTNPSSETIVVSLNTGGGTATEGTDYTSIDGTLVTFLAGETSATVTVSSTEDAIFEGTETFSVTGAQVSGSVVTGDTGTGTILDDDNAPTLLIGDATATEGNTLVFDVTLTNPSAETIVVSLNTGGGSATEGTDYTSIDGTLVTFLAGETSATVTVSSLQDTLFEGTETFSVTGTQVSGSVSTGDTGTGTILDDDNAPTLLIGDATANEGNTLVFDVTLTNPSTETIVVSLNTGGGSATEGTDYTSIDGTLVTFLAGETSATVTVSSTEDAIFEGTETFSVTGAQVSGSVVTGDTGTGTILDDDNAPTLLIGDATANEGDVLVFDVTLSNPSAETIVVQINTASGAGPNGALENTDFTSIDGTLVTFLAGETSATVTVSSTEDTIFEPNETFIVSGTQVSGSVNTGDTGTGTILNDDPVPTLIIGDATATEGDVLVFDLALTGTSQEAVVVTLATTSGTADEGTDFASADGILVTFAPGATTAQVSISSIEDDLFEQTETFTLGATGNPSQVVTGDTGTGTIIDDDSVPTGGIATATVSEAGNEETANFAVGTAEAADGNNTNNSSTVENQSGNLNLSFGDDGPAAVNPFVWSTTVGAVDNADGDGTGTIQLTSGGFNVTWQANGNTVLEAVIDDAGAGALNGTVVATLTATPNGSGGYDYSYQQIGPFDHPEAGNAGADDTIQLSFSYTITDGAPAAPNGDTATGSLTVTVQDDEPTGVNGAGELVPDASIHKFESVQSGATGTNIAFVVDVSDSTVQPVPGGGTRLSVEIAAIKAVLQQAIDAGVVGPVLLVAFHGFWTGGNTVEPRTFFDTYGSAQDALDAVDSFFAALGGPTFGTGVTPPQPGSTRWEGGLDVAADWFAGTLAESLPTDDGLPVGAGADAVIQPNSPALSDNRIFFLTDGGNNNAAGGFNPNPDNLPGTSEDEIGNLYTNVGNLATDIPNLTIRTVAVLNGDTDGDGTSDAIEYASVVDQSDDNLVNGSATIINDAAGVSGIVAGFGEIDPITSAAGNLFEDDDLIGGPGADGVTPVIGADGFQGMVSFTYQSGPNPSDTTTITSSDTVTTFLGGTIEVNFETGNYLYTAPTGSVSGTDHFTYVLLDGDDDPLNGVLDILVGAGGTSADNSGFETDTLLFWSAAGAVWVEEDSKYSVNDALTEGGHVAVIHTGNSLGGETDNTEITPDADRTPYDNSTLVGFIDQPGLTTLNNIGGIPGANGTVLNGSVLKGTFNVTNSGTVDVSFDWQFLTDHGINPGSSENDIAFVVIEGQLFMLANSDNLGTPLDSVLAAQNITIDSQTFTNATSFNDNETILNVTDAGGDGIIHIAFGVVNAGATANSASALIVDDIHITP